MRAALLLIALFMLVDGAEAARDKIFVYHLNASPDVLDPAKCNNQRCQRVMWPIYEPLVNLSPDLLTVVPGLAEAWDVTADGLTYTFRLRKGVSFHDGTPFTASAAKLNLERNFLKDSRFYSQAPPNVRESLLTGLVKEISVQDDHTLRVDLKSRRVHLLFLVPMRALNTIPQGNHELGAPPDPFP